MWKGLKSMQNKVKFFAIFFSFILLLGVFAGFYVTFSGQNEAPAKDDSFTIGVLMPGSVSEVGWNGVHYQGIKQASDELGVKVILKENVREKNGDCARAVSELIEQGVKMIILGSYNYPKEVENLIAANPKVRFYSCSSEISYSNFFGYFARVYQARYLSGIVAALQTKSNVIGYVAAMKNSEVIRGIDAFALGVRSVNPKAKVVVAWTNSWDDVVVEKQNVQKLVNEKNADVIAYHQNQLNVVEEAEKLGVYSIAFNVSEGNFSERVLTSITTDWKTVYKEVISDYLKKKDAENISYWLGIEIDAVRLAFYSPIVNADARTTVQRAIEELKNGKEVFSGEIFDNKGHKRCGRDEIIGDASLFNYFDWLVKGVEEYED